MVTVSTLKGPFVSLSDARLLFDLINLHPVTSAKELLRVSLSCNFQEL